MPGSPVQRAATPDRGAERAVKYAQIEGGNATALNNDKLLNRDSSSPPKLQDSFFQPSEGGEGAVKPEPQNATIAQLREDYVKTQKRVEEAEANLAKAKEEESKVTKTYEDFMEKGQGTREDVEFYTSQQRRAKKKRNKEESELESAQEKLEELDQKIDSLKRKVEFDVKEQWKMLDRSNAKRPVEKAKLLQALTKAEAEYKNAAENVKSVQDELERQRRISQITQLAKNKEEALESNRMIKELEEQFTKAETEVEKAILAVEDIKRDFEKAGFEFNEAQPAVDESQPKTTEKDAAAKESVLRKVAQTAKEKYDKAAEEVKLAKDKLELQLQMPFSESTFSIINFLQNQLEKKKKSLQ